MDEDIIQELLKDGQKETKDEGEEHDITWPDPEPSYVEAFEALIVAFKWFWKEKKNLTSYK